MAKSALKRAPATKRAPRKAKAGTRGFAPQDCRVEGFSGDFLSFKEKIEAEDGVVVGHYQDPLGKHPLLLAMLPILAVGSIGNQEIFDAYLVWGEKSF